MLTTTSPFARAFAAAAVFGALAIANPVHAKTPAASSGMQMEESDAKAGGKKMPTAEEMAERVETRIQNLHEKLKITPEQESAWNDVAQTMRDSETKTHQLIHDRHQNAKSMNAIEDLESYQKIAQSHADGLGKVISSFQSLYENMSPDQQKNADDVFNRFEGHRGMAKASMKNKGDMPAARSSSAPSSSESE